MTSILEGIQLQYPSTEIETPHSGAYVMCFETYIYIVSTDNTLTTTETPKGLFPLTLQ